MMNARTGLLIVLAAMLPLLPLALPAVPLETIARGVAKLLF